MSLRTSFISEKKTHKYIVLGIQQKANTSEKVHQFVEPYDWMVVHLKSQTFRTNSGYLGERVRKKKGEEKKVSISIQVL